MPSATKRPQTYALDRAATRIGGHYIHQLFKHILEMMCSNYKMN
jgi:hypothetical protein